MEAGQLWEVFAGVDGMWSAWEVLAEVGGRRSAVEFLAGVEEG
jgi:hypothetical protein